MNDTCIFCKIIKGEIPAKIEHEDSSCIAFHDINPRAKTHLLIIPKKHISTINDLSPEDNVTMGNLMLAAKSLSEKIGLPSYRLMISVGKAAGQEVFHVHMHMMSPS
jgi:histidine triad (HIT) family protein